MSDGEEQNFGREYERNSRRAHLSAYVLVAGLTLELINAAIWYKGPETLVEMAAVLLIVGGVWGEVFFGRKARIAGDSQLAQYEARTAEANQRAQEAALELAKFREPRVLGQEQMYRIAEKLKKHVGIQFAGATSGRNPEYLTFLQFIETSLMLANWQEINWHVSRGVTRAAGKTVIGTDVSVSNVLITFPMDAMGKAMEAAAIALADALTAEGFEAKAGLDARNAGAIQVMVGPKT
jgi:hypothetical protein